MKIEEFQNEFRWLSNFTPNSYGFCVEFYYQAAKATNPKDRAFVFDSTAAGDAKNRGHAITCWPDWEERKTRVMLDLLRMKFSDSVFREKLLSTGNSELIEGNHWHDTFWGVCNGLGLSKKCKGKHAPFGENHLGKLLMQVRKECREVENLRS